MKYAPILHLSTTRLYPRLNSIQGVEDAVLIDLQQDGAKTWWMNGNARGPSVWGPQGGGEDLWPAVDPAAGMIMNHLIQEFDLHP